MAEVAEKKAHFTCVWAVENTSVLDKIPKVGSPVFTAKSLEMTKWMFVVCNDPKGTKGWLSLQRMPSDVAKNIEIDFEVSLLDVNGLPLVTTTGTKVFSKYSSYKIELVHKDEVFIRRRAEFLPKNVLTLRCRMWKARNEVLQPEVCFVHSVPINQHFFYWAIPDVDCLQTGKQKIRPLSSYPEGSPELILTFCLTECSGKEYLCIGINRGSRLLACYVAGEISLLNMDGAVVHSVKVNTDIIYEPGENIWVADKFFEKQKLLSDKFNLLPSNVLHLRCEFDTWNLLGWDQK